MDKKFVCVIISFYDENQQPTVLGTFIGKDRNKINKELRRRLNGVMKAYFVESDIEMNKDYTYKDAVIDLMDDSVYILNEAEMDDGNYFMIQETEDVTFV